MPYRNHRPIDKCLRPGDKLNPYSFVVGEYFIRQIDDRIEFYLHQIDFIYGTNVIFLNRKDFMYKFLITLVIIMFVHLNSSQVWAAACGTCEKVKGPVGTAGVVCGTGCCKTGQLCYKNQKCYESSISFIPCNPPNTQKCSNGSCCGLYRSNCYNNICGVHWTCLPFGCGREEYSIISCPPK